MTKIAGLLKTTAGVSRPDQRQRASGLATGLLFVSLTKDFGGKLEYDNQWLQRLDFLRSFHRVHAHGMREAEHRHIAPRWRSTGISTQLDRARNFIRTRRRERDFEPKFAAGPDFSGRFKVSRRERLALANARTERRIEFLQASDRRRLGFTEPDPLAIERSRNRGFSKNSGDSDSKNDPDSHANADTGSGVDAEDPS